MNPAVSLGFLLARKISVQRFLCYVAAQLLGSITGSALVYAVSPSSARFHLTLLPELHDACMSSLPFDLAP